MTSSFADRDSASGGASRDGRNGGRTRPEPPSPMGADRTAWRRVRAVSLGAVAALTCFLLALGLIRSERGHGIQEQRIEVLRDLATLRANLERELAKAYDLGSILMTDVAISGTMTQHRFERLAREVLAESPIARHVGLSEGLVLRWIYPLAGNEAALGLNYRDIPGQLAGISKAIETRSAVLDGPLTLAQGTRALVVRRPIFLSPRDAPPRSGPFWGVLSLVLRTDRLFTIAGLMEPDLPLALALRHAGESGVRGEILGSAALFEDSDAVVMRISLPDGDWELAGKPKAGWRPTLGLGADTLTVLGVLLSLGLGLGVSGGVTWLDRKRAMERGLREAKARAEGVLNELTSARAELARAERLSSLGALVESVTHEVSNPLSASLTAATFLEEVARDLEKRFNEGTLRRQDMAEFLGSARQVSDITSRNLTRAAQLIESFKQVAVDQASDVRRSLDLRSWLEDVRVSLTPRLNRTHHRLLIHCPDGVILDTRPGALFQVLTQLVIGALRHADEFDKPMILRLSVTVETDNMVALVFQDESPALDPADLDLLSEGGAIPGGGKRGLASCQALVTGPLMGVLTGRAGVGRGNTFVIRLPRVMPS